jgi:SAM-dependent methyltransferase
MTAARYDGHADWYHENFAEPLDGDVTTLTGLLGPGAGQVCLDLACGTGRYLPSASVEVAAAVVAEVARCLRPGGHFAYIGVHPCFVGMFVDRVTEARDGSLWFRPGYGARGWAERSAPGGLGLSTRVGFHHKTLDGLLGAFTGAGLHLTRVTELWRTGSCSPGTSPSPQPGPNRAKSPADLRSRCGD